jgi:hypothetical protein
LRFVKQFPEVQKQLEQDQGQVTTFADRWAEVKAIWLYSLENLYETLWGSHIADFMVEIYDSLEVVMTDVTISNVGQRYHDLRDIDQDAELPGQYLSIMDPGNSKIASRPNIDVLPEAVLRENPGIPYL